jgi:hypothetical protein
MFSVVALGNSRTFRRDKLPSSSRSKQLARRNNYSLFDLLLDSKDGIYAFLGTLDEFLSDYTVSIPTIPYHTLWLNWLCILYSKHYERILIFAVSTFNLVPKRDGSLAEFVADYAGHICSRVHTQTFLRKHILTHIWGARSFLYMHYSSNLWTVNFSLSENSLLIVRVDIIFTVLINWP